MAELKVNLIICYLSSINGITTALIDYLSSVYRDYNAVTIGEFNDMFSYMNKRNKKCKNLSSYLYRISDSSPFHQIKKKYKDFCVKKDFPVFRYFHF